MHIFWQKKQTRKFVGKKSHPFKDYFRSFLEMYNSDSIPVLFFLVKQNMLLNCKHILNDHINIYLFFSVFVRVEERPDQWRRRGF